MKVPRAVVGCCGATGCTGDDADTTASGTSGVVVVGAGDGAAARSAATRSRTAGATSPAKRRRSSGSSLPSDERADALAEGQVGQLLGPLLGRAVEGTTAHRGERAADVEQPADVGRRAPGLLRRVVDDRVAGGEVAGLQVPERGQPAVGQATGEREHPRLVGTEPDADVVRRRRAALGADHPVELALDADAAACVGVPQLPDDVDRLLERAHALPRAQPASAHRLDGVPERAGAEAELDPPAAEQVEAGDAAGQDGGRAKRQVRHVRRQVHGAGAGRDVAEQRPGVEEARLVRVVLEGHQVEAHLLRQHGEPHGPLRVGVAGRRERPEGQVVAVVGHRRPSSPGSVLIAGTPSGRRSAASPAPPAGRRPCPAPPRPSRRARGRRALPCCRAAWRSWCRSSARPGPATP